jgi:methyl-accepting chemotaxis protein
MKILHKLAIATIGIAATSVLSVAGVSLYIATTKSHDAMEHHHSDELLAMTLERRGKVLDLFDDMRHELQVVASAPGTKGAAKELRRAFLQYPPRLPEQKAKQQAELDSYYRTQFGAEYAKKNDGQAPPLASLVGEMSPQGRALQYAYIAANPHPLGSKLELEKAADGSEYSELHARYHNAFKTAVQRFGFYDLFLVDAETADVYYTVFKELDFGNNLRRGNLANSSFAKAFEAARVGGTTDFTFVSDFEPYGPSYGDSAAFVATPLLEGSTVVAVMVVQVSLDRVGQQLQARVLDGETIEDDVETFLVGSDGFLRSVRPALRNDKPAYLARLAAAGASEATIKAIDQRNTSVQLEQVGKTLTELVARREKGVQVYEALGTQRIGAFAPFDFDGKRWTLVTELDQAVATASAQEIQSQLIWSSVITVLLMLALATVAGVWVARSITRPISGLAETMGKLEQDSDFGIRADDHSDDEVGSTARALNSWIQRIQATVGEISRITGELARGNLAVHVEYEMHGDFTAVRTGLESAVESLSKVMSEARTVSREVAISAKELSDASRHVASGAHEQTAAAHESLSALEETSSVASTNADAAKKVQSLTEGAGQAADLGQNRMAELNTAMTEIDRSSGDIVKIIKVIDEIAFQTNLLALNAAVEAARAGRHGRGFAVVAQEVQNLAARSARAAKETAALIESSGAAVKRGVTIAGETSDALSRIVTDVRGVKSVIEQVTRASAEQATGIEQVRIAMQQVNVSAEAALQQSSELEASAAQLTERSGSLRRSIERFTLSEGEVMEAAAPPPPASAPVERSHRTPPPSPPPSTSMDPKMVLPLDHDERGYAGF